MEIRQNINIRLENLHNQTIKGQAVPRQTPCPCNFRARLPLSRVCRDVFLQSRAKSKGLLQSVLNKAQETIFDLKCRLGLVKNFLDFSKFENKDISAEFSRGGCDVLFECGFGGYLFRDKNAQKLLKTLKKSKNLTLDNAPHLQDCSKTAFYDFPIRFALAALNTFQKKGNANIFEKIPPVFEDVKLKNGAQELFEKLDMLPSFLEKIALTDKNKYVFKIGKQAFYVQNIGYGGYGTVYKIQDVGCKKPPAAMKVFYNPYTVSCQGMFGEIGLAKELSSAKLKDVPEFFMANPIGDVLRSPDSYRGKGGWMMTEFVDKNTPLKKQSSETLYEFLYKLGLDHGDLDTGNQIGGYTIDLGGIASMHDEQNSLVFYGIGGEISRFFKGMRKGESVQDLITALEKRLKTESEGFV